MEFKKVVESRYSVREFSEESVTIHDIKEIIRLAGLSPSIGGSELWKFIAITNKELLTDISEIVKEKYDKLLPDENDQQSENVKIAVTKFSTFFPKAPLVIAVVMGKYDAVINKALDEDIFDKKNMNELRNYPDIQSIGAAIQTTLLAAVELGYGACWLTGPMVAKNEISELLKVNSEDRLVAFVAIGKPARDGSPKRKKDVDEILTILN
ncbi:MAG: nitroreductase family protein [Bacteroidetes bacterium]|nr:nitroreductase family protein [Bacteroidota bacterium]